ncbi:TIGR04540 family protein [Aerococcus urinaeequi]|uniref:TIGR04540 family protein n=1 Tax=Aerococcus urinaeequi TaxID=51665 RepID=UPI003D6C3842
MKIKKFYRTQREVGAVINEIVDEYWADNLTDKELEEKIIMIYKNNQRKIKKMMILLRYLSNNAVKIV